MNEEELQLYKYLNGLISYLFTRNSRNKILEMFSDVLKQNEAYKNVIKEAIEYTKSHFKEMVADEEAQILLNILNKVGGSDE